MLRESLRASTAFLEDERFNVYEVSSLLGAGTEQYLYFGASVFWRAAARSWNFEGQTLERIGLGPRHEEQFRLFLLGEGPFPTNARLFVHVWSDDPIHFTTVFPTTSRVEGVRRHKFCIPGILFILFVGGKAAHEQDAGALNGTAGQFMWLCPWQNDSLFNGFGRLVMGAIQSGRSPK